MSEQISSNKRRSALLLGAFVVLVVAVVWLIGALIGHGVAALIVGLVLAAVGALAVYLKSDAVALAISRATLADPDRYARLHNVVEGLCVAAGLPKPRVYVIDDPAPNAFATGRNPRHAAIAVTTGLLDKMSRIELEGILAHELSHVKNYDVLVSTLAVSLVGLPAAAFRPVFGPAVSLAVGTDRECVADLSGVALTRYPPGLISALEKVKADDAPSHVNSRATAHLWIAWPHPPLDERIKVLKEL